MNENDDPYQILGVCNDASDAEIKKAYRKLALKHHPDKATTEEARLEAQTVFAKIANAYEILSDPEEREQYDLRKKYGGAPGTRYTTTKSPGGQPSSSTTGSPQYTTSSTPRTTRRTSTTKSSMPTGGGGPARTQYSQKNGKFTATVTREDGTTYTFMGSANGFQDPYEVFRKAFQDKTGEELPDDMKPKMKSSGGTQPTTKKNVPMNSSMPQTTTTQKNVKVGTKTSTTIEGNMKVITKTETLPNGTTRTSVEKVPIDTPSTTTTKSVPQQRRVVTPTPQTTTTTRRMSTPKQKSPMTMNSGGNGGVQPVGKSTKTRTVHHADGSVETITETTETMSDGTTRTSSSSKFSNKSSNSTSTSRSSMPSGRRVVMTSR